MAQQKHEPIQEPERVLSSVKPQEWGWSGMAGYELVQPEGNVPVGSLYHIIAGGENAVHKAKVCATSYTEAAEKGAKQYVLAQKDLFDTKEVTVVVREDNAFAHTGQLFRVYVSSVKVSVDVNVIAVRTEVAGE